MSTRHTVVCDGCGLEVGVEADSDGSVILPESWYGLELWHYAYHTVGRHYAGWLNHVCGAACALKVIKQITQ